MRLHCAKCNSPIEVADLLEPQISNTPGVSVLVVEHPKRAFCLECKSDVAVMLVGANLHLRLVPIQPPTPRPSPIVLASALPKNGKG